MAKTDLEKLLEQSEKIQEKIRKAREREAIRIGNTILKDKSNDVTTFESFNYWYKNVNYNADAVNYFRNENSKLKKEIETLRSLLSKYQNSGRQ